MSSESEDPQRTAELALVRALGHAKLGEHADAEALMTTHAEIDGELADSLRDEIRRARDGAQTARED